METISGSLEIEYLEAELRVIQRAYPSQTGRLLSYINDRETVVNVEERIISFDDKDPMRVIISRKNEIDE
ncbi:MAG: hypothetical protein IPM84_13650 [Anaerolineae bacterium]|nr:hypothetical protein [Anaerolineae bacterium]